MKAIDRNLFARLIEWAHTQEDVMAEARGVTAAMFYHEFMQAAARGRREADSPLGQAQNLAKLGNVMLGFFREIRNDSE